ncbi:MAG: CPBP family intramembrane glutamic endopeptidase [Cyanobacteria bacterium J06639_1]
MTLSRQQLLIAMGATAALLGAIAKIWMGVGHVQPIEWMWDATAIAQGLGLGVAIVLASQAVYRLWPAYRNSANAYLTLVLKPLAWPDVIWLGVLPGLSEELLFRGVALAAIGLTPLGVAITSIIFGSLHLLDFDQWPYGVWAAVIGIALGTSAIATGNLLVPVVAHVAANALSGSLWKARLQQEAS